MRKLRVTIAQINTTVGDLDGNLRHCVEAVRAAEELGSELIVFPELALSGYPPEDLLLKPGFLKKCSETLKQFADCVDNICAVIGCVGSEGEVYNSAAVISGRQNHCMYHKMFLPNYGVFDEKRYFASGTSAVSFMLGDVNIGLNICEDTWVDNGPHCTLAEKHNVDLILNLSASPFHAGKQAERNDMLTRVSQSTGTSIVYANLIGGQDELVFDGGSMVFGNNGECFAKASSFKEELLTIDMEFDSAVSDGASSSAQIPVYNAPKKEVASAYASELSAEEEILEALVLGTRDYIRKNGFSKAVIGLSGGIDSALVAAIAVTALGAENVTGITMPSEYTSSETRTDAEILADNLGIGFKELPISQLFREFTGTLADSFRGCEPNVAEENIQARIRGTLLMALSNKFGCIVLTTGNKSEMSTGYATLYGDMAGGFAVIKDVPKLTVYAVSRLINEKAGREIIPQSTIDRPPTAELRHDQKDSDSLPPYEVLDAILKAYVEDDMGVDDIVSLGFDSETVKRVIRLCDISEYKRRQAPPGVKITPRAFGRDRRLPITNRFRP
ncbi:NAD+ synthase [Candidatus Latescibacterota bacterium]